MAQIRNFGFMPLSKLLQDFKKNTQPTINHYINSQ